MVILLSQSPFKSRTALDMYILNEQQGFSDGITEWGVMSFASFSCRTVKSSPTGLLRAWGGRGLEQSHQDTTSCSNCSKYICFCWCNSPFMRLKIWQYLTGPSLRMSLWMNHLTVYSLQGRDRTHSAQWGSHSGLGATLHLDDTLQKWQEPHRVQV